MPKAKKLEILGSSESLVFSRAEPRHKQVRLCARARGCSPGWLNLI
jgi:hypothetical protein